MTQIRTAPTAAACGLLLTTALAACGGGGSGSTDAWAGTVTDSAGVSIVANPEDGVWGSTPAWTLTEEYRVGGMDADTDAQFGQVVGMDRDADGNLYVADQQAATVRVFSPDGTFLRTIGSPGQGPGEIGQAMSAVFVVGTEVWVADMANLRVNQYALDGSFVTSQALDLAGGIPIRWDKLAGDRVVVQRRALNAAPDAEGPAVDAIVFFGGEGADTLATLPQGQSFQLSGDIPQFRFFEAEPVWDAARDGRLASAMNSDYRIEIRAVDGSLERIITRPWTPRPVPEADQQMMLDGVRELFIEQGVPPQGIQLLLGQATFADHYPAFAQVLAGPSGTLWVQRLSTPQDMAEAGEFDLQDFASSECDVFDAEGRYLGVMTLPTKFTPLGVDGDAFWGVQRDEFDVQSVVRYRLVESG